MANPDITISGNAQINGTLTVGAFSPPDGSIDDGAIAAAGTEGGIDAGKLQKSIMANHRNGEYDATVVVYEEAIHVAEAAATIEECAAGCYTAPTGGDLAIAVDIKKNGTTILAAVIDITSSQADREMVAGTLSGSPTLAAGDWLTVHVTVSGSTGTQGKGLWVWAKVHEKANA